MITSSCHCGAVMIETEIPPEVVTECNCSICRRLGARWAHYTREHVQVTSAPGALVAYVWGDREIEFYHCARCGCTTHYEFVDKRPGSRLSINTRGMDPDVVANARVRLFDGASM